MRLASVCTVSHTDFYRAVLRALKQAEVDFLIGGTYALAGEFAGMEDFEVVAYLVLLPEATA